MSRPRAAVGGSSISSPPLYRMWPKLAPRTVRDWPIFGADLPEMIGAAAEVRSG